MSHKASCRSFSTIETGTRITAPIFALLLGLAAGAAPSHATDGCTAGAMAASTASGEGYTCKRNCALTTPLDGLRVLGSVTFSGHDATLARCLEACSATPGCTAVHYSVRTEMRDGIPYTTLSCGLYGGDVYTTDTRAPSEPGRHAGVCFRNPNPNPIWQDPRFRIDTRVIDQDLLRPRSFGQSWPRYGKN